jgi:hypothetical protein
VNYVLRVDDFGWTSEEEEYPTKKKDVGLEVAKRFHDALNGVPYLAGVIPAAVDLQGRSWIESAPKGLTVALHGWKHQTVDKVRSEFHGMDPQGIRTMIDAGQKVVGPTKHFIPPFNAYDEYWGEPLWHEGIRYVWGRELDWPTPPHAEIRGRQIFIPAWARLYGALAWVQGAAKKRLLDEIELTHDQPGIAVMTLHLPWESARDPKFNHLREMSKTWRGYFISADDFVKEIK